MTQQTLKSIQIGEVTATETTEGSTVKLSIKGKSTTLSREDFTKLEVSANELFTKETVVKCSACGHELECNLDLSEKIALVTVAPCQKCPGKDQDSHENT